VITKTAFFVTGRQICPLSALNELTINLRISLCVLSVRESRFKASIKCCFASGSRSANGSSSFLESRILQAALMVNPRVAPHLRSLCAPTMSLRVAPNSASSGCADGKFSSYPESSLPRLRQRSDRRVTPTFTPSGCSACASPGCPGSCLCGWVDDDSPAGFELCILGLSRG